MSGVSDIIENIRSGESETSEFAIEQCKHRLRGEFTPNRMRYDRILGEMFWHIALLGLHLNPGQGAASGEHVDARRAVVERAGDIHSGETAAENGDRALTAEACPQATEGVSLNVVSRRRKGRQHPGSNDR